MTTKMFSWEYPQPSEHLFNRSPLADFNKAALEKMHSKKILEKIFTELIFSTVAE